MRCAESLRAQAYFDGEVDAVSAAEIERHAEHCAECHALLEDLTQLRAALRRDATYERTPPALRARIMHALDQEAETPRETETRTRSARSLSQQSAGWRTGLLRRASRQASRTQK